MAAPSLIITQAQLGALYIHNPSPAAPTVEELALAVVLGCRIEPGPMKLSVMTDEQGYQRLIIIKN